MPHPDLPPTTPADEYEAALIRKVNDLRAAAATKDAIAVLAGGLSELTVLRGCARSSSQIIHDAAAEAEQAHVAGHARVLAQRKEGTS